MTVKIVTGFVALALLLAVAVGASGGLDAFTAVVLVLIVLVGILAIAVARRSATGRVKPATCPECSSVISPNAPYCKRCGARL